LAAALNGAFLTGDLFNLFVFAELLVISATLLTAISDDRYGVEAAYKYFYMSLFASALMLLAIGSLYASYGTLNMADLATRVAAGETPPLLPAAVALLLVTFLIKSAVPPFHFWQPDFHTAAPTAVSAMLSSVVVKLGIYGLLRMTTLLFLEQVDLLRPLLLVLGAAGVLFGGLAAVGTGNVKRMLAYSTLAQVGFILVGIGWGTPLALAAAIVFAFNHSLVKAAMLMLAGAVASRAPVKSAAFAVVRGAGRHAPAAGALFFVGGLALAGVPPTNGFVSKLLLFQGGIEAAAATPLAAYLPLALIAAGGVLTLIYTMRAFQLIWWQPAAAEANAGAARTGDVAKKRPDQLYAPALLLTTALALGIWAEPLVGLAWEASRWLGSPEAYIQAVLGG
jgi:multicomponent Na+:H+ antiporter subunit D